MTATTKGSNKPSNKPTTLPDGTIQQDTNPSGPEQLYYDISSAVHGRGLKRVLHKKGNRELGEEIIISQKIINVPLCEWRIPPENKKEDCTPNNCSPRGHVT